MRKQPPTVEWQIAKNDAEWARLCEAQPDHQLPATPPRQAFYPRAFELLILALALGVTASGWWWLTQSAAPPNAPAVLHEQPPLHHRFEASDYDRLVTQVRRRLRREVVLQDSSTLTGIPIHTPERDPEPAFVIVKLQDDWAVIGIVSPVKDGWLGCLEQRVYQRAARGWQPAVLDAEMLATLRRPQNPTCYF